MNLEDEVRSALKPLINRGLVVNVQWGVQAGHIEGGPIPQKVIIELTVDASDPEQHRAEVDRAIEDAGLAGRVLAHLHSKQQKPSRDG